MTYKIKNKFVVRFEEKKWYENPQQSCLITGADLNTRSEIIFFPVVGFILLFRIALFYFLDKI